MKGKWNKKGVLIESQRTIGSLCGTILYAIGINFFIVPSGMYSGGVLGICQVIRTLLIDYCNLPLGNFDFAGLIYYIANIPIFILAYKQLGKKFFYKTFFTVTMMTAFLSLIPTTTFLTDPLACSIMGGIITGSAVGIILRMGSSSGGMDIIGIYLAKRKQNYSVGKLTLIVNLFLYATCLFLFDIDIVLYSMIYAAVASFAVDKMHIQNINVEVHIITKVNPELMEQEIFETLGRGITKWQALGAFTNEETQVLYVTMSKYEVNALKNILQKYDPKAFIVVSEGVHVVGHYLKKL